MIDWFSPGDPRMDGAENVEQAVVYTIPVASALIRFSTALARDAAGTLAMAYHRPDAERSYIGVMHRGQKEWGYEPELDSIVYLAAPDERDGKGEKPRKGLTNSYAAPSSIEFGHYTSARQHGGEGPRTKADHQKHWVPGLAPLRKAAKKMVANRRLSIK